MSDVLNENGHFDPVHEAHSIEQVLFIVQIERSFSDEELSNVRREFLKFKNAEDFPTITENQGFILMGTNPMPFQNGFILSRMCSDGTVERELKIERNSITFKTSSYLRWKNFEDQVKKYFEPIFSIFSTENKVTGISLSIIDKFVWLGNIKKCNASYLLSPESDYLCKHIFKTNDLWHSHTGVFIGEDSQTKRLLNVNIDSLDDNKSDSSRRVVVIATVVTDLLNQLDYESFDLNNTNAITEIEKKMQKLHLFSKEVFGNIINEKMSKRIALIE